MARVQPNIDYNLWQDMTEDPELIKASHFSTSAVFSNVVVSSQPIDGSVLVETVSRGLSRSLEVSSVTPIKKMETKRRKVGGLRTVSKVLSFNSGDGSDSLPMDVELQSAAKRFDSALRSQLSAWTDKLIDLQPKVYMSPHIMECALCLFKALRQRQLQSWIDGMLPKSYISNRELMRHDLVAVWWIAMKHCSVRTAVPNRALLSRATDSKRSLLSECELSALCALDWDVQLILKTYGLVIDTEFQ